MIHRDGLNWYVDWEWVKFWIFALFIIAYYSAVGYCIYRVGLVINHFVVKYW